MFNVNCSKIGFIMSPNKLYKGFNVTSSLNQTPDEGKGRNGEEVWRREGGRDR